MTCYVMHMDNGSKAFLCGDLGPHCSDHNCGDVSGFQCDFPVSDGKTCDLYVMVLHTDEPHPHVHMVVNSLRTTMAMQMRFDTLSEIVHQ